MAKNFITGIGGFVASHLADYLLEKGEEVFGTYRWTEDLSRVKHIKNQINLVSMDLLDLPSCIKSIKNNKPDYIYHLAAQSYVDDSFAYPVQTIMTNTVGTLNLLEAVRLVREIDNEIDPIIHICSSSEVYGKVTKEEMPIKETNQFRPQNPYAVGKIGADMISYVYWQCYLIKTIRTRAFTHTGPRRTMMSAESSFARQIALIENGLQPPIIKVGNLDSIRTIADVRDMARAYYLLVRKCWPGEVYNIGGNRVLKIGEILEYLISLSTMKDQIHIEIDKKLLRPSDVTLQIPDTSKFEAQTGWKPEIPFEKTMQDLLDWWRTQI